MLFLWCSKYVICVVVICQIHLCLLYLVLSNLIGRFLSLSLTRYCLSILPKLDVAVLCYLDHSVCFLTTTISFGRIWTRLIPYRCLLVNAPAREKLGVGRVILMLSVFSETVLWFFYIARDEIIRHGQVSLVIFYIIKCWASPWVTARQLTLLWSWNCILWCLHSPSKFQLFNGWYRLWNSGWSCYINSRCYDPVDLLHSFCWTDTNTIIIEYLPLACWC